MKKNDLILIIDMQKVYLPGEAWACPTAKEAAQNICRLLDEEPAEYVIFTRFTAPDPAIGTWKNYNIANAAINASEYLNDMMEELKPYLEEYPLYDKSTYTSGSVPEIIEKMQQADRVVITGVVADCCVLATMMDLIDQGHKVVYLKDCISGSTKENEEAVIRIAKTLEPVQTLVMGLEEYLHEAVEKA